MTLRELLARPAYDAIEVVAGTSQSLERPVRGIHSSEYEHPAEWVEPDWVILTLGLRLRRNVVAQRELVAELDEAGVTALGLGLGSGFESAPRAIIDAANERDFPIFTIPVDVSFRDMIRDVYLELMSEEARSYRRLVAMQHHLLDALDDRHPQQTVLERLAHLLHASVGIIGPDGYVERSTGRLPAKAIAAKLATKPHTVLEQRIDAWRVASAPVSVGGGDAPRWLVAAVRRERFDSQTAKSAVQIAAPLLGAMARLDQATRRQERELKASILNDLTAPDGDVVSAAVRASAFGLDFSAPARVAVIGETADDQAVRNVVADVLEGLTIPHLVGQAGSATAVVVQGGATVAESALVACLDRCPDARMATGREVHHAVEVSASLRDAELGVAQMDDRLRLLRYEELDLSSALLSEVPRARIEPKVTAMLEALHEHPDLRATLDAFFDHDMDVTRTAEELHLHPNSLRYRLRRVEALIGRPLRSPSTIAALHLARLASSPQEPKR
jgi:DNA-binding PucR family transcriptional regulator